MWRPGAGAGASSRTPQAVAVTPVAGRGREEERNANFAKCVLGCRDADFCKFIFISRFLRDLLQAASARRRGSTQYGICSKSKRVS